MLLSKLRYMLSVYQHQSNVHKFQDIKRIVQMHEKKNMVTLRSYCSNQPIHTVQMRGLEHDTTEKDIIDFFKPLGITPKAVYLKLDGSGRVAGGCEVEFSTHADAVVAMRKRNAFMGNRFVRLTLKSSVIEENVQPKETDPVKEFIKQMPEENSRGKFHISENIGPLYHTGHIIKMKNAPKRLTDQAIYEFFWPIGISPISVKPMYNESGIRTGEFEVQFLTKGDAVRAMIKNNAYLRKKFVEISLVK